MGPFWTWFVPVVNLLFTLAKRRASSQSVPMVRVPSPVMRLRWKRRFRSLVALLLLGGLAFAAWTWLPAPVATIPLVHVIDGDSLAVRHDNAQLTLRLRDIDAVEYRQDCTRVGARWPCGREARTALERLAGRGPLHCELTAKDRYGRTLAICRTAVFPAGVDLGAEMVRLGWAIPTNDAYMIEETEARANRRGIWDGGFVEPVEWRAAHERPAIALTPPDA